MSRKRLRFFLVFLAVSAALIAYQGRKGSLSPFGFLAGPFYSLNGAISSFSGIFSGLFGGSAGRTEVERLRAEAGRLRLENMKLKEAAFEAERLRELLQLKERTFEYFASAKVVSSGSDPWSRTVVIDKGSSSLIEKGMAVATPSGLAGKVHRVYAAHSIVLLIDDKRFRAAARLQASRTEGIYAGTGSGKSLLQYVDSKAPVQTGEILVTSGLDGVFPPGISIGYVSRVSKPQRELFQNIEVTLFADTAKLEEAVILR